MMSCLAEWTGPRVAAPAAALARMRRRWCQVAKCCGRVAVRVMCAAAALDVRRRRCFEPFAAVFVQVKCRTGVADGVVGEACAVDSSDAIRRPAVYIMLLIGEQRTGVAVDGPTPSS